MGAFGEHRYWLRRDYVGVTDYVTKVDAYLDGRQGYTISDPDGTYTLTFDPVDPTGLTAVVSYFLEETGYETADSLNISYVGASSTVTLVSASGDDMELIDGAWTTLTADISAAGVGSLVVSFDSNSASESLYLDNVYSGYVLLDLDDDNDARLVAKDYCPLTNRAGLRRGRICDDQDLDDDNDGVFDYNDEFPYDGLRRPTTTATASATTPTRMTTPTASMTPEDAFPNDPTENDDFDGDGVGDNADTDDDGDGVADVDDLATEQHALQDTDGDGIADFFLSLPYDLMDFETGALPTQGVWTSYSCSIGGGSAPVHPSVVRTHRIWAMDCDERRSDQRCLFVGLG